MSLEIHILGCGSALPTGRHLPSSQAIINRGKVFLIDCGEGTQLQLRKHKIAFSNISGIFISHLHGDHCLGLIGLISTLGILGRRGSLTVYAPKGAEKLFREQLNFYCNDLSYEVVFVEFDSEISEIIYQDKGIVISTIPLNHSVDCCGFLFEEVRADRHIVREMVDFYRVPIYKINSIKKGDDFITDDGEVIPNARLTKPSEQPKKYAYCSDTAFYPGIVQQINEVDLLYHEATFDEKFKARAEITKHSTAKQAAEIARMAKVKQLLIGHFSARYKDETVLLAEAKEVFENTVLAKEGLCMKL